MSTVEQIWGRIQEATGMTTLKELAKHTGANYQYLAKKIKKGEFSTDWAFKVAQQYKLSTDWILTGKGERTLKNSAGAAIGYRYILLLNEWAEGFIKENPKNRDWLERQIERALPEFEEWLAKREDAKNESKAA